MQDEKSKIKMNVILTDLNVCTQITELTSSPICGTNGERRGTVSIIQDGGSHSSGLSPPREEVGF